MLVAIATAKVDRTTAGIAVAGIALLARGGLNAAWLVVGGGLLGVVASYWFTLP